MSWVDILKKNDNEFEINIDKDIEIKENHKVIYDPNIIDIDEEFEKIYSLKIYDIHYNFKQLINENVLPFLNIKTTTTIFFDFINFISIIIWLNKENR